MGSALIKGWIAAGLMVVLNVAAAQVHASNAIPEKKADGQLKYCQSMRILDYQDEDKTIRSLRGFFQNSDFKQLDQAMACLVDSPKRFLSGKTGSAIVYLTFRLEIPAPGVRPEQAAAVQQCSSGARRTLHRYLPSLQISVSSIRRRGMLEA